MSKELPFTLTKKSNRPCWYVRFKSKNGGYTSMKTTGKTDKREAINYCWEWYKLEHRPDSSKNLESLDEIENRDRLRKEVLNGSAQDLLYLCENIKQRGIIKSYVETGSKQDVIFSDYLLKFWSYDKSEYIAEKLRKEKQIHKAYCKAMLGYVQNYWKPFFISKHLGALTKQDIKAFMKELDKVKIGNCSKNHIMQTGFIAIKYAFNNELIDKDITAGIENYSGKSNQRQILTPELAQAVFNVEWNDPRAKLANMLAMCTGLRAGEIQALRYKDLGQNGLYIQHSWNMLDGLKSTKNGENRYVCLPFPEIIQALKQLAETNPFNQGLDGYVFWATIPTKPMESKTFLYELRQALLKMGMEKTTVAQYTFHAWRHYFTAYMNELVNQKILQMQTGHKTVRMLEHYADHKIDGDIECLEKAQIKIFGDIIRKSPVISFNQDKLHDYIKVEYKQGVKNE